MMLEIKTADGVAQAYLAGPEGTGPFPGVLLFMDAFGVRPQLESMADRVASWGYVVLAPNVFYRSGSIAEVGPTGSLLTDEGRSEFFKAAMPRMRALTPARSDPDTSSYLKALTARPEVSSPVGVIGFCMGARLAVRAACDHPEAVTACAGFHGGRLADTSADSPHLGLGKARAEFVFGHADGDRSMPPADVARLGAALEDAGLTARNEVYPGANHGYTMADTSEYSEEAAERAFATLRELLDRTLPSSSQG